MSVYIRSLAQGLGRQGVQVDVFSRRHDSIDPFIVEMGEGSRLIHVEAGPPEALKTDLPEYIPTFIENVKSFVAEEGTEYDLVHSHYWLSGPVGIALAEEWDKPHVATFHTLAEVKRQARSGMEDPIERSEIERLVAAETDAIVVSDAHERDFLARLYDASPEKVAVVPGGVDIDLFHPRNKEEARRRLGLNGDKVILCVGRLDPLKGVDLTLASAALLEDRNHVTVILVGGDLENDPEAKRLVDLADALGMTDRVRFEGAVPHEDLPWYYSAADLLMVPSYYESFGLVALEAMACGTPVVAARVGGLPSLVKDGETGYLVPWHCPEPFAERLEVLLAHDDLRNTMGKAAYHRAQGMAWESVVERFATLYEDLISREVETKEAV
jgi:D-inositol-3-phosphate glycosyltransferase